MDFNSPSRSEPIDKMLPMRYIAQLIGHNSSIAYLCINITMRVTVNPVINSTVGNIIAQFHGKGTIDGTATKLCRRAKSSWHVMRKHNSRFGFASHNGLLNKLQASLMLSVEIGCCQQVVSIKSDTQRSV